MIRKSLDTDEVEFFIIGNVVYIGKLSEHGHRVLQEELRSRSGQGADCNAHISKSEAS